MARHIFSVDSINGITETNYRLFSANNQETSSKSVFYGREIGRDCEDNHRTPRVKPIFPRVQSNSEQIWAQNGSDLPQMGQKYVTF